MRYHDACAPVVLYRPIVSSPRTRRNASGPRQIRARCLMARPHRGRPLGREPHRLGGEVRDPPDDGDALMDDEVSHHADAIRGHRIATITKRLGAPIFTVRIAVKPSHDGESSAIMEAAEESRLGPIERPSREPHEGDYLAAIVTPLGIRPIRGAGDLETAQGIADNAYRTGEPAMIFGVARRKPKTTAWLSTSGIAAPDGLSLFNLKDVEIKGL